MDLMLLLTKAKSLFPDIEITAFDPLKEVVNDEIVNG